MYKGALNENCPANEIIDTAEGCKIAADVLELPYSDAEVWFSFESNSHPLGCIYRTNNHGTKTRVYFNKNTHGETNPGKRREFGGVCSSGGRF